jgi:hypothetical protein
MTVTESPLVRPSRHGVRIFARLPADEIFRMRKIVHQTWIENETELNALQTEPLFFSAQTTPNFSREVRSLNHATVWYCSPVAANFAGRALSGVW